MHFGEKKEVINRLRYVCYAFIYELIDIFAHLIITHRKNVSFLKMLSIYEGYNIIFGRTEYLQTRITQPLRQN